MKFIKGCIKYTFIIILLAIFISAIISSISKSLKEYNKKVTEFKPTIEETTKIVEQKKETKNYEIDYTDWLSIAFK